MGVRLQPCYKPERLRISVELQKFQALAIELPHMSAPD